MIHNKHLTELGFICMDQYFEYIIESEINGQFKQRDQLIKDLSKDQKKDFIDYCDSLQLDSCDKLQDIALDFL